MVNPTVNIFLIEPNNKSKYKTMIAFADDAEEARMSASVELNPARAIIRGREAPLIDHTYLDGNLSKCQKINVEIILTGKDIVHIKYLENEYHLSKNFARAL